MDAEQHSLDPMDGGYRLLMAVVMFCFAIFRCVVFSLGGFCFFFNDFFGGKNGWWIKRDLPTLRMDIWAFTAIIKPQVSMTCIHQCNREEPGYLPKMQKPITRSGGLSSLQWLLMAFLFSTDLF